MQKTACTDFTFTVTDKDGQPLKDVAVKVYGEDTKMTDEGPDSDDSDNDNNNNGNQNGDTDSDDNNSDNQNANNNNGNNTPGNGSNNNTNTNGSNGNKAPSTGSSLLPQTGEQVALYSLVGMLLIGAAFMLFKRNRRKA